MWKRCAQGLSGASCTTGTATFVTWSAALAAAVADTTAGYSDWRLPNKKELESIVESCGSGPAINQILFPATPAYYFWSSSSVAADPTMAWAVNFDGGDTFGGAFKTLKFYVRLVRGGQPFDSFDAQNPPTAQRTFVSSLGIDTNACTLPSPCRMLTAALAATSPGGEIIVLDSAGYGPVVIDRPVTIVARPGVYAGISVSSGTGIVVNPGSGRVTLAGLTINGLGGTIGIDLQSGDALYIDDCTIGGFSQAGINAQPPAPGALYVRRTSLRDNALGLSAGLAVAGTLALEIEYSTLERNGTGLSIVAFGALGALRNSAFNDNGTGLAASPTASGASASIDIRKSTFNGNGTAIVTGGTAGTTSTLNIVTSLVAGSSVVGIQTAAGGTTWIADTTIRRNAVGVQQTAGGVSVSFGNNRLLDNASDGSFTSTTSLQ